MSERRIGTFSLPRSAVEGYSDAVRRIMGEVVVVKADFNYVTEMFDYVALSPKFDMMLEHTITPKYVVVATLDSVSFERVP